jgi:hypothetical protein|eukprot:SAG25_NODE_386_length_8683_cov_36.568150_5_plen_56_part_00
MALACCGEHRVVALCDMPTSARTTAKLYAVTPAWQLKWHFSSINQLHVKLAGGGG